MAVFPDKIVQKSSTDTVGEIAGQINESGSNPIIGGELVIARGQGNAQLLTLDANGTPVVVGQGNASPNRPPEILLNFEDPTIDTGYVYASGIQYSNDAKFGAKAYSSQPSFPSTPRPNPILIGPSLTPLLGTNPWTLEFWIKSDPADWIDSSLTSLLVWSHKDYLFGKGAFTITLDGGNTTESGGLGTSTSQTSGQAFGSIVFGLGGQYGTHGNQYVPTEGDIVSSRSLTVVDNDWHHVCFTHEGIGRYACFVDGLLTQRTVLTTPVDHNDSGTSGIPQPSGVIISGVVNINDDMPFPGQEFFGGRFKLDSVSLIPGVAKYVGQNAITVPTAPFDFTPFATPSNTLSGLYDTHISLPVADGDVLQWDGTDGSWKNSSAPAFNISGNDLGDIGDVTLEATNLITDKELLAWDATAQNWINYRPQVDDLGSVTIASLADGEVLKWNNASGQWENSQIAYSELSGAPTSILDLTNDLDLADVRDVNIQTVANGDVLAYDGTQSKWVNLPAPPVSLSANSINDLGDVTAASPSHKEVLVYDYTTSKWTARGLLVGDVSGAASKVSELEDDVDVSYWTNDAGYLTGIGGQHIDDLGDVTITSSTIADGMVLVYRSGIWVNEYGPPANISTSKIGQLADVTYYRPQTYIPGELTIDGLGTLHWDDPSQPSNLRYDMGYKFTTQGLGFEVIRGSDETGSSIYISRGGGVDLRSDVNIIRLRGNPDVTTNRPELRFETGDYDATPSTGFHISLKMPASVLESVTYYLPQEDGDVGDVLATDGSGALSWVARTANNELGSLTDVDLATQLPGDGNGLVYNAAAQLWVPGVVSSVDLSSSSINALQDVDTNTTAPQGGQALVWDNTSNLWVPGTVAADLGTESINELSDVDTSTTAPSDGEALVWDSANGKWVPGVNAGALDDLTDVDTATNAASTGDALVWNGTNWVPGTNSSAIDDLSDVDTSTTAPNSGEGLIWTGLKWVPGPVGDDLSASSIDALSDVQTTGTGHVPANGQALIWNSVHGHWMPGDVAQDLSSSTLGELSDVQANPPQDGQVLLWNGATWLPGDVASASETFSVRVEDTVTAAAGLATFTGLGGYGLLYQMQADADCWVVLYSTAAERTADASRALSVDPASGSGVLMEFYLTAGQAVRVSPSTSYYNADSAATSAIYAAIRNGDGTPQTGTQVIAKGYGLAAFDAVSGGTFGSG